MKSAFDPIVWSDFLWACLRLVRALVIAGVFVGAKFVLKKLVVTQTESESFIQVFEVATDFALLGLALVITIAGVLDVVFVVLYDAWRASVRTWQRKDEEEEPK